MQIRNDKHGFGKDDPERQGRLWELLIMISEDEISSCTSGVESQTGNHIVSHTVGLILSE